MCLPKTRVGRMSKLKRDLGKGMTLGGPRTVVIPKVAKKYGLSQKMTRGIIEGKF